MGFFPSGAFAQADFSCMDFYPFFRLSSSRQFSQEGFCLGVFIPVWAFVWVNFPRDCFLNDGFRQGKFLQWGFCPVSFFPGWDFVQLMAFILWAFI